MPIMSIPENEFYYLHNTRVFEDLQVVLVYLEKRDPPENEGCQVKMENQEIKV